MPGLRAPFCLNAAMKSTDPRLPVTLLTGFLGSGKTTLLNRILQEAHGQRIAVIENEFGEVGVDNDLLLESQEQIVEMNNGCICCTVRGDLVRILGELAAKRQGGELHFDRVLIETTGLADPGPVAQTFLAEPAVAAAYRLDAILTLVDARHAMAQLDQHPQAQEQVGFADRLLLTKTDLVSDVEKAALLARLVDINGRAAIYEAPRGQGVDLSALLDVHSFSLEAVLAREPDFLASTHHHHHQDAIGSFAFVTHGEFDAARVDEFLGALVQVYGDDMLRYKGVLAVAGQDRQVILQGVHQLAATDLGRPWGHNEARESRLVFIGRQLPREIFEKGLRQCLARSWAS